MESKPTDCNEQQEDTNSIECRACLQKFAQEIGLYNLFEAWPIPWPGMGCTIAEDLTKMAQVQISIEDNLKLICFECCSNLQRACKFVHIVQNNDLIVRQRYSGATDAYHIDWPKPIQLGSCKESSYVNNPDIEIKQEIVSDEETEMIPQENSEGMVDIKIEPEELVQPVHSQFTNGINGNDAPVSSAVNGQEFQEIDYLEEMKQEPPSEEDVKQQFVVSLECILCSKRCKSVSGLKSHVIAMHSYKGVKRKLDDKPPEKKHVCSTCRRSFATSTDLMVHETCHNKLVCYSCNRNFETFNLLTRHRKTCIAAVSDVVKPKTLEDVLRAPTDESRLTEKKEDVNLECAVCKEQFSDVFYLQVHQEIHNITVKTEDKEKEIKQEILDQFSDSAYGTAKLQELFEDDSK